MPAASTRPIAPRSRTSSASSGITCSSTMRRAASMSISSLGIGDDLLPADHRCHTARMASTSPTSAREDRAMVAILAGGASSRMGRSKASVQLARRPLISYSIAASTGARLEPVVVAKAESELPPLRCRVVREDSTVRHPLAGIIAALELAGERPAVVVGCDMPFVPPELLAWLGELDAVAAVPMVDGRPQPPLSRYTSPALDSLRRSLARSESLGDAMMRLEPDLVTEEQLARFGEP